MMVEQLMAMEEYEVTYFMEKIASKFSPKGRVPMSWFHAYIKVLWLSSHILKILSAPDYGELNLKMERPSGICLLVSLSAH
jgi:hypothetical protein